MNKKGGFISKKNLSLRFQFLILLVLILFLLFLAITFLIIHQDSSALKKALINRSKSFSALATQSIGSAYEIYQQSGSSKISEAVDNVTQLDPDISQVEILDTSNHVLFIQKRANPLKVNNSDATSISPTYIYNKKGDIDTIVQPFLENFGFHKYNVVYGISYNSVENTIRSIVLYISALSVVLLLLVLAGGYLLINKYFLSPVVALSRMALDISKGDTNRTINMQREDEIGDLARAVDTMAKSLKDNISKLQQLDIMKKEFLMITSHNLRTPLTVIEGYVENLKMTAPAEVQKKLEPIIVSVNRLKGFAEDILTISSLEAGNKLINFERADIAPLLLAMAGDFAMQARQKHIDFQINISTQSTVNLSKPHFRSALWNLLDNAYKFTPEKGTIILKAVDVGGSVEVSVIDNGPGITADEVKKLFTKFHRGTSTLEYNYEGTGIGLYLSKIIINQHGGTINVNSQEGAGSTFTIILPTVIPAKLN